MPLHAEGTKSPMIAPEPTAPRDPRESPSSSAAPFSGGTSRPGPSGADEGRSYQPVGTLRGAGVNVDTRVAARVAVVLGLSAIAVVAIVLFVAGHQKNAQISSLQTHGVPIDAKVTGCIGLLGGSGSNGAGYDCTVTYVYGGQHYAEGAPGNDRVLSTGSTIKGVIASDDPALFSTPRTIAGERASAGVYLVPSILAGVFVVLSAVLVVRLRRARSTRTDVPSAS
jgi:hypothetical protein